MLFQSGLRMIALISPVTYVWPLLISAGGCSDTRPLGAIHDTAGRVPAFAAAKKSDSDFGVTGDLTIHGVTRKATFDFEELSAPQKDPWGNLRIGLSGTTKINRKDYGLNWNAALEAGGFMVGDDVTITLDVQFVKS